MEHNPTVSFPFRFWNPAAKHSCCYCRCRPSCCLAAEWSSPLGGPEPSSSDCSESSPESRLSGTCLPVLPAFQPLYPSDHVSLGTWLILVSGYFLSFVFRLPLLLAPGKSVAQYTASLCLWVLPVPSPHLLSYGLFSPFCGPSHPEGVDIDSGGIGATLRHQEALLPHWKWILLSNC